MRVAKKKAVAPRVKSPRSVNGAEWARQQKRLTRVCETCTWGKRNPKELAFIEDAWAERLKGADVSRMALWRYAKANLGYPFTDSGLRCHQEHGPRA